MPCASRPCGLRCSRTSSGFALLVESRPSAIFFCPKNGKRSRKASLHSAVRHNFTSSRGDSRSSLNLQAALLVKTLPLVACKEVSCACEMQFVTNNFDWSAYSICDLYLTRGGIEVVFKEIKQTLQPADFPGTSENAIPPINLHLSPNKEQLLFDFG